MESMESHLILNVPVYVPLNVLGALTCLQRALYCTQIGLVVIYCSTQALKLLDFGITDRGLQARQLLSYAEQFQRHGMNQEAFAALLPAPLHTDKSTSCSAVSSKLHLSSQVDHTRSKAALQSQLPKFVATTHTPKLLYRFGLPQPALDKANFVNLFEPFFAGCVSFLDP